MNHRLGWIAAALSLGLVLSTSAHAAWRSFGYPDHHTDLISIKNDAGTAAFNLQCRPGNNDVELQLIGGPKGKSTTMTLAVDGRTVAKHAAIVTNLGSSSWVEFGGVNTDADIKRWLTAIAGATGDITISAGSAAAHFPAAGASSAATTAISYCKL
jgi:hypothetical protein